MANIPIASHIFLASETLFRIMKSFRPVYAFASTIRTRPLTIHLSVYSWFFNKKKRERVVDKTIDPIFYLNHSVCPAFHRIVCTRFVCDAVHLNEPIYFVFFALVRAAANLQAFVMG